MIKNSRYLVFLFIIPFVLAGCKISNSQTKFDTRLTQNILNSNLTLDSDKHIGVVNKIITSKVLVIDEASQIKPEDSFGAIARAK